MFKPVSQLLINMVAVFLAAAKNDLIRSARPGRMRKLEELC